jgi:DNA topoisomerase-1
VEGHSTQPPARYTEASLVKALEEMGVGRPSTYATILDTIQGRGYVWKKGTALVPSWTAFAVVGLLERHFGELVDYGFTASMEEDLDEIASGDKQAVPWLSRFYFGNGQPGLKQLVSDQLGDIDAREINSIPIGGPDSGIVVRVGRYGPYVQRGEGEERASLPEDLAPDELTMERADDLLSAGSGERIVGHDPQTGLPVIVRAGRYGPYVQLGTAEDASAVGGKPRTASLFRDMEATTLGIDDALQLLSLPRVVGTDPVDGAEIVAMNGRYGPYLKKGTDSRSLATESQLFTVTLPEALAIYAMPKTRRGSGAAAAPLRELGPDPETGAPMLLRDGRFGPYVTDGTTNASLRKGDTVEGITAERAAELLADRRAAPPRPGRPARKAPSAKKATQARKAAATRTGATKSAAKKAVATRSGAMKTGAKKASAKKTAPKKAGTMKAGTMKTGAKKTGAQGTGAQGTAARKTAAEKASTRKAAG